MKYELAQIRKKIFYLSNRDKSVSRFIMLTQRATEILKKYRSTLPQDGHYPSNLDLTISQLEARIDKLESYEDLHGPKRKHFFLSAARQDIWSDLNTFMNSNNQIPA